MSLLQLQQTKKSNALAGFDSLANADESRKANNEALKSQDKQQKVTGVSAAAGTGLAVGLAVSGPVGWAVGGTLALLSLF